MNLPKIEFSSQSTKKSEAIVAAFFAGDKETAKDKAEIFYSGSKHKDLTSLEDQLRQAAHFKAKKNEVSVLRFLPLMDSANTICLGLGSAKKINAETFRQLGATLYKIQEKERFKHLHVLGDTFFSTLPKQQVDYAIQAFSEGYFLASYQYAGHPKEKKDDFKIEGLDISGLKISSDCISKAEKLIEVVNFARSLGDKPANFLTPTILSKIITTKAKEYKVGCKILNKSEIEKQKMGLFLSVAQGSIEEPKFIVMEYSGGKKTEPPICLVGKGITFDSGGISIKPASKMEEMKYDMMGSACVSAICLGAAALKLPVNLITVIAATENMPGGKAQKPGDVQTSMTGKTVEVINTDAEGRLVLADAIEYVQKYYKPQCMIDFATLTGAVLYALGSVATGIMGNHEELLKRIKESSAVTGEKVWELPLFEEYEEDLKSTFADIKNSGISEAGSSKGGTFLKFFVDKKIPWVHCDIAGTAWGRKDVNYYSPKFASGAMIRLMLHLLERWQPLKHQEV